MTNKHPSITVDDLWKFERVGGLSLSPDGAQAVCSVGSYSVDDNIGRTSLWLLSTLGGAPRRLTHCSDKDGQPKWSPTGERIAFVAKREQQGKKDETAQLYVIPVDGGEAERVSNFAPGIGGFKWFPDGKRVAFIAWVWPELKGAKAQTKRLKEFNDRKTTGYVTSEAQYRFWDVNLPMGRVAHLHALDLASGRITDLFEGSPYELPRADPDANAFDISPDGRHIVFTHDAGIEKRMDNPKVLVELQLRSGRFTVIAADAGHDFDAPRYSPDGQHIAMTCADIGIKHTMPNRLALLERGGAWQWLSDDWDRAIDGPLRWSVDAGSIWFTAQDRGRCHLYRFELASRRPQVAVTGGWVTGFDVAAGVVATVADSACHPGRVQALRWEEEAQGQSAQGQAPMRIERFNDAAMAGLRLGEVEEISVTGALGEPVQVWINYPPGFDRKKKYPVLQNIHGGPHSAAGETFHYRWNTQAFAAQGFVVASVNYHGSSGFGHAFLDSITHRWGELELQDVEAATDWLLAQPWADRKRVYAAGGSYGGYMVAWMNGHVPAGRYQAYVCHAGCFDWTAMFSDDAWGWHAKELGASYWDDPAKVQSQSPSSFVAAMQTPTLVIHGALDYRVPDQQGLAYYNTLKARGIDARLLWFPDENHWILKPRNSQLWYSEFFDWLKRHGAERRSR